MGWLKRVRAGLAAAEKASELAQEVQRCQNVILDLTRSVVTLGETVEAQRVDADQLRIDWATTLDKIGRWASRQSARERKDTHAKLDTLAGIPAANGEPSDVRSLTKTQLRARAALMRRGNVPVDGSQ